jgi:hypothetical protein
MVVGVRSENILPLLAGEAYMVPFAIVFAGQAGRRSVRGRGEALEDGGSR